ncbi:MAG: NAD(P)-dependent oxidoreductase [Pseudomonadota bacterium]
MTKKALVIGGSGFLGSHIANCLSNNDFDVTVFDLQHSRWLLPSQKMVVGSILDSGALGAAVEGVDVVYHLAGEANIERSNEHPKGVLELNINGGLNAIDVAAQAGVSRFMFASSVYTYGNKGSFYRVSKQALELILESYGEKKNLPYTILQYGTLYGARSQKWNGLRSLLQQGLETGVIRYNGTGEERREFIHVADAARLSIKALDEAYLNKKVIISGLQTYTAKELLMMIQEIVDNKITYEIHSRGNQQDRGDHYFITPHRSQLEQPVKIVTEHFIDLSLGIVEVLDQIRMEQDMEG